MKIQQVILLLFILLVHPVVHAQEDTDVLRDRISQYKRPDTAVVHMLCELSLGYRRYDADSAFYYAQRAKDMAEALDFERGKAEALRLTGATLSQIGNKKDGLRDLNASLLLYKKLNDSKGIANVYNEIAIVYYFNLDHNKALNYWQKALNIFKKLEDEEGVGKALGNMANVYLENGKYTDALGAYNQALASSRKRRDSTGMAIDMSNIADLYSMLGKFDEFRYYNDRSINLNKKLNNKSGLLQNYVNNAFYFSDINMPDSSIPYFLQGLALSREIGEGYYELVNLENLGEAYLQKGDYKNALKLFSEANDKAILSGDTGMMISAQAGIAQVKMHNGELREGIDLAKRALAVSIRNNYYLNTFNLSKYLADGAEAIGDYKGALEYYKLRSQFRDSIHYEEEQKKLMQLQFDQQVSEKDLHISGLRKEAQLKEERIAAQNKMLLAVGIGSLLLLGGIFNIYYNRQRLKKTNDLISAQKEVLEAQSEKLEESNQFKDKVISILSHDLRSPLAALDMTLRMSEDAMIDEEEAAMMKAQIHKQINSLYITLDNLVVWSKSKLTDATSSASKFLMHGVVEDNILLLGSYATNKGIILSNNLSKKLVVNANRNEIDTVLRNLLTNAIKFTSSGGSVSVGAIKEDGFVKILVADTGVGMDKDQIETLFSDDSGKKRKGTSGEGGSGLGLMLAKDFVDKNGGTIDVISEKGKGSTFMVTLPHNETDTIEEVAAKVISLV